MIVRAIKRARPIAVTRAADGLLSSSAPRRGDASKIILTGRHTYGIRNVSILSWGEGAHLFIGGFCSIAGNQTVFLGGNHRTDWATTFPFGHISTKLFPRGAVHGHGHPSTKGHVVIENDVWIGDSCTVMSGVKIGSGSVLAANSVVVKDVEPYTVVGGNPARPIKRRFPDHVVQQLLDIRWWDMSDGDINELVPLLQQPLSADVLRKLAAAAHASRSGGDNR